MFQRILWFVSGLAGFSAAYLIWLTLLQDPLTSLALLAGRRGIGAALLLAAGLTLCVHLILSRLIPSRINDLKPKHWILLLIISLTAGILVSSYSSRQLPENRLLLPVNKLEIISTNERHPDSSGSNVALYWFTTSEGDISFSEFSREGSWTQSGDGLTTSGDRHAALSWKGRTGNHARLIFLRGPEAGIVTVLWNGDEESYQLYTLQPGQLVLDQEFDLPLYEGVFNWIILCLLTAGVVLFFLMVGRDLPLLYLRSAGKFITRRVGNIPELPGLLMHKPLSWKLLYVITFTLVYLYFLMEWIFLVTKPSFMDVLGPGRKIEILFFSASLAAAVFFILISVVAIISKLPLFRKSNSNSWILMANILPACILAALLLLLIDNFIYTLFGIGIVTSSGMARGLIGALFIILAAFSFRDIVNAYAKINARTSIRTQKRLLNIILVFLLISLVVFGAHNLAGRNKTASVIHTAVRTPNIIIVTPDGINAANMSVYGYERDTTPHIRALAQTSLVAENAFSNSGKTTGSITSMLTGKHPLRTRVVATPDIFKDVDAYQHLPNLLRSQGYTNIQFGVPNYVDARAANLLDSFDIVNEREIAANGVYSSIANYLSYDASYFLYETGKRIIDRMQHIFYLQTMQDPKKLIDENDQYESDMGKIEGVLEALRQTESPIFAHLHLMNTHGPVFSPHPQVFSAGKDMAVQEHWDMDIYDDTILETDGMIGVLIDALEREGMLDNTILIIGSDHGQQYTPLKRIPLIMRFPGGEYAGRITANVQNLDIAPTILDYLGLSIPEWMEGQSLLQEVPPRPILGISVKEEGMDLTKNQKQAINDPSGSLPFLQSKYISLIYCQYWYQLDILNGQLNSGAVAGYTSPCPDNEIPGDERILDWITGYLEDYGFDTSGITH
jgi:hypothetical protein